MIFFIDFFYLKLVSCCFLMGYPGFLLVVFDGLFFVYCIVFSVFEAEFSTVCFLFYIIILT